MKPNPGRLLIWGLTILVCSAFEVEAAVVTLAWDLSSSPNIAGYRLYSGTTSGVYSQTIEVGNTTSILVSNLETGKTYFFVVTAYDTMGVESAPSNEVSYLPPPVSYLPPPTTSPTQVVSPARRPKIGIDHSLRRLAFPPRSLRGGQGAGAAASDSKK